jgi:hypothetical protein
MDVADDHTALLRAQACRRLLKHLFGELEPTITSRYQTTAEAVQDYMAQDAFGSMEEDNPQ